MSTQGWLHGRLVFVGNENSAPFPSAVVYLGANPERFYWAFRPFGRVVQELDPELSFGG
jgi:hypothetical protein